MNVEFNEAERFSGSYALRYDNQTDHPLEVAGMLQQ